MNTETHLPGKGAVQYGDEEGLGRVEGGEEVSQEERRSGEEHQARGPGDALQEEQRQGAHRPRSVDSRTRNKTRFTFILKSNLSKCSLTCNLSECFSH